MMNLTKPDEKIAILTCMDMRLDPKKFPVLEQSKAYVIRNAGGRANEETIRSLVVAHKFQGAKAIFVIQHTDCGMMNFTNDEMNLMCIYQSDSRSGLIAALTEMRGYLDEDEAELRDLTDSALQKLDEITDEDFAALELVPDFDKDE